jgi:prophage tail gpP-like protein
MCKWSEEIEQPMKVKGLHPWNNIDGRLYIYEVTGTHRKKKNTLSVTLMESQLAPYSGQENTDGKDEDQDNAAQ